MSKPKTQKIMITGGKLYKSEWFYHCKFFIVLMLYYSNDVIEYHTRLAGNRWVINRDAWYRFNPLSEENPIGKRHNKQYSRFLQSEYEKIQFELPIHNFKE